jgi:hypothetical protein
MRILIWATTLQADILALALHLDRDEGTELMVVTAHADRYLAQPIAAARPFRSLLVDRADPRLREKVLDFRADAFVADNHFPPFSVAPRACAMWHGLGFKARGKRDIADFHKKVCEATGIDPARPNRRFMAQCYGEPDFRWRVENWGLHPDNCRVVGMAYSDLILAPPYTRADIAPLFQGIDIMARKNVLVSITWHYGGIFARQPRAGDRLRRIFRPDGGERSAEDARFIRDLIEGIDAEGANTILCLHSTHRYDQRFFNEMLNLASRSSSIAVRLKDRDLDNLADLVASDAMASNLSSFITYKYLQGQSTVHICPARGIRSIYEAEHRHGRLGARKAGGREAIWMNEPEDNGGITAYTFDETLEGIRRGLREPDCCAERAAAWVGKRIFRPDGNSCSRFAEALRELCDRPL